MSKSSELNSFNGYSSIRLKPNTDNNQNCIFSEDLDQYGFRTSTLQRNESNNKNKKSHAILRNKTFSALNQTNNKNHNALNEKQITSSMSASSSNIKPIPPKRTISLRNSNHSVNLVSTTFHNLSYQRLNCDASTYCSDEEVLKVESCYRSMGAKVFASNVLVDLFSINFQNIFNPADWIHEVSGIPVWIFNTGINPKRKKCLTFVLADRVTGFALRKIDSVNYLNEFKWARNNLITFRLTNNDENFYSQKCLQRKQTKITNSMKSFDKQIQFDKHYLYALEFRNDFECSQFYDEYRSIAYDTKNRDLFDINFKPKQKDGIIRIFCRRITKDAISSPCAFQHISSIPNVLTLIKEDESSFGETTLSSNGPIYFNTDTDNSIKENFN